MAGVIHTIKNHVQLMQSTMNHSISILFFMLCVITTQAQTEEWPTLSGINYSIDYPAQWQLDTSGQMGTKFLIFSPVSSTTDLFKENVNLIIQDFGGQTVSLDEYVEYSRAQIAAMFTGFQWVEDEHIADSAPEYHKLVYAFKQGTYDLQVLQRCFIHEGAAYILTFTAEVDSYASFLTSAEKVLDTFEFR